VATVTFYLEGIELPHPGQSGPAMRKENRPTAHGYEQARHREHPRALLHYQHYNYDATDDRSDDSLDFIRH
jgi:hypothetical protein